MLSMEDKKCQSYYILCNFLLDGRMGWTIQSCRVLYSHGECSTAAHFHTFLRVKIWFLVMKFFVQDHF